MELYLLTPRGRSLGARGKNFEAYLVPNSEPPGSRLGELNSLQRRQLTCGHTSAFPWPGNYRGLCQLGEIVAPEKVPYTSSTRTYRVRTKEI